MAPLNRGHVLDALSFLADQIISIATGEWQHTYPQAAREEIAYRAQEYAKFS